MDIHDVYLPHVVVGDVRCLAVDQPALDAHGHGGLDPQGSDRRHADTLAFDLPGDQVLKLGRLQLLFQHGGVELLVALPGHAHGGPEVESPDGEVVGPDMVIQSPDSPSGLRDGRGVLEDGVDVRPVPVLFHEDIRVDLEVRQELLPVSEGVHVSYPEDHVVHVREDVLGGTEEAEDVIHRRFPIVVQERGGFDEGPHVEVGRDQDLLDRLLAEGGPLQVRDIIEPLTGIHDGLFQVVDFLGRVRGIVHVGILRVDIVREIIGDGLLLQRKLIDVRFRVLQRFSDVLGQVILDSTHVDIPSNGLGLQDDDVPSTDCSQYR